MCEFLKAMADGWGAEKHDLVLVTDDASNISPATELGKFPLSERLQLNMGQLWISG